MVVIGIMHNAIFDKSLALLSLLEFNLHIKVNSPPFVYCLSWKVYQVSN